VVNGRSNSNRLRLRRGAIQRFGFMFEAMQVKRLWLAGMLRNLQLLPRLHAQSQWQRKATHREYPPTPQAAATTEMFAEE